MTALRSVAGPGGGGGGTAGRSSARHGEDSAHGRLPSRRRGAPRGDSVSVLPAGPSLLWTDYLVRKKENEEKKILL